MAVWFGEQRVTERTAFARLHETRGVAGRAVDIACSTDEWLARPSEPSRLLPFDAQYYNSINHAKAGQIAQPQVDSYRSAWEAPPRRVSGHPHRGFDQESI
jgi:hypothetical protein